MQMCIMSVRLPSRHIAWRLTHPYLSAEVAKGAVVDVSARLIVKKVADVAIVASHAGPTLAAAACTWKKAGLLTPPRCRDGC